METRELIRTALLVALCVAVGYLLAPIPNIELLSAAIFTSGVLTGPRRGAVIGCMAETLYSGLNPYGFAPLPLLLAQVLAMTAIGTTGGVLGRPTERLSRAADAILAGVSGLVLTLFYDILTNLAGYVLVRESTPFLAYMIAGLSFPFPLAHAGSNIVSFALVVPSVRRAYRRWSRG